jgi:hypothetical protein
MANQLTAHEQALRTLPLAYSLALRLRDAGVAPTVICEDINVEEASLCRRHAKTDPGAATEF